LAALLVIAMVVAVAVVADVKWRAHQRAVARQHLLDAKDSYLAAIRGLDDRIGRDLSPTEHVLAALSDPRPGDVFAARDAFAGGVAESALKRDLRDLSALHPPAVWAGSARTLRHAVEEMRDAVSGMRKDSQSRNGEFLSNDLQSNRGGTLTSGIIDWQEAIKPIFRDRHQKVPGSVARTGSLQVPATLTSWVFGVDRACIASKLRDAAIPHASGTLSVDLVNLRKFAASVAKLAVGLRAVPLPRPQAAALRREVVARWKVFDSEAKILRTEADQLSRGDLHGAQASVDRLKTLEGAVPLLDRAFRRYHAIACGGDPSARPHHPVAT
jgi:hypothetical protein